MLEDYGVGRGSLREALRILEVHGLITMKPGRNGGPMVIEVGSRDYGRMSSLFFHIGGVTFRQLVEARLALEPMMARLAAERRGQELVGALADPETTRVEDDAEYFDATTDFHKTVAAMSGNPVLNLMSSSLEEIFRDQVSGLLSPKDERKHVLEVHTAIADAIAARRGRRRREAHARAHAGVRRLGLLRPPAADRRDHRLAVTPDARASAALPPRGPLLGERAGALLGVGRGADRLVDLPLPGERLVGGPARALG